MDINWNNNKFGDLMDNKDFDITLNTKKNKRKYNVKNPKITKKSSTELKIHSNSLSNLEINSDILWSELYQPMSRDQLIINKAKIREFEQILASNQNLIIIRGPSGCGKHCLINCLASELNIQLIRWQNDDKNDDDQSESSFIKFKNFIRSASYNCIVNLNNADTCKALLIDEIPFYFISNPIEFINIIKEFSLRWVYKILIVVTMDNNLCPISRFCNDLINNPLFIQLKPTILNMNKITTTGLANLFKNIIDKEFKIPKKFKLKTADLHEIISISHGDARFFLNSIQFLFLKSYSTESNIHDIKYLNYVKDCSLGIFHYTGKILYIKRDTNINDKNLLPPKLQSFSRNEILLDINQFVSSLTVSPMHLVYNLHQNCIGFIPSLEKLKYLFDIFSQFDIQSSFWNDNYYSITLFRDNNINLACRAVAFSIESKEDEENNRGFIPLHGSKIYNVTSKFNTNIQIINRTRFAHSHLSYKSNVLDYSYYLTNTEQNFNMEQSYSTQPLNESQFECNATNKVNLDDTHNADMTDDDIKDFSD